MFTSYKCEVGSRILVLQGTDYVLGPVAKGSIGSIWQHFSVTPSPALRARQRTSGFHGSIRRHLADPCARGHTGSKAGMTRSSVSQVVLKASKRCENPDKGVQIRFRLPQIGPSCFYPFPFAQCTPPCAFSKVHRRPA